MRRQQLIRPRLLLSAACVLFASLPADAVPYPKDDLHEAGYGYLMPRDCAQYCGYNNMYCCSAGSTCYTSDGIAGCSAGGAGGGYAWYTTTWTLTETFTSTFSSHFPASTGGTGSCVPPAGSGQIACGSICCASSQYCAYAGQCLPNVAGGGGGGGATTIVSGGQTITTQYSAPYRVTSGTGTVTETGTAVGASATSTGPAVVTGGTASSLSPGAIAGIVIGTLAGIVLLLAICACFVVRGLWHGMLALLGLGPKKHKERTTETVIEEERYTRRGSTHSRRDNHGSWYGGRPSTVASRKEKKSSGNGWLGLGAAAGTLLLLLGLRRDNKKQRRPAPKPRSDTASSYWSSNYSDDPSTLRQQRQKNPSHTAKSRQQGDENDARVARTVSEVSEVPWEIT
ncbi:hypothetical protein QBC46DRAFT_417153 [Diplogelasinospora grovesii]|uniref:Uncharacterized protein n=1 Tax=Diplogelasinospora grovesii TaxID=303347 RepID=A0AAN6S269_9PEZI|nr:hypothetical protein QBC46DRAFT_417153 [Diplogelasinospora grovesii]